MISDILTYIGTYDSVRAAVGLGVDELPDSVLALPIYTMELSVALGNKQGVYGPVSTEQTLQEIFDRPLADTDPMYGLIRLYSIYVVAGAISKNISLWAVKSKTDGKASVVRFSGEQTYQSIRDSVFDSLRSLISEINELLGISNDKADWLTAVTPSTDLVTNL